MDTLAIFGGMYFLKDFWANYRFQDPEYYHPSFMYFNVPLYIGMWLLSVYFSGGYDDKGNIRRMIRGLLMGTILLAAVYGFLDQEYRASRTLIILGMIWAVISMTSLRLILHFIKHKNFNLGKEKSRNLIIVGSKNESKRVMNLIHQAQLLKNFIGTVSPNGTDDSKTYLSNLQQLDEVVHIYKIDEIIFCSKDISSQDIMKWMTRLGPEIDYKIVPEESLSIIGSSSKNSAGELYTIDIQFRIANYMSRRNKRFVDFSLALIFLFTLPVCIWLVKRKGKFVHNIFQVIFSKKSWVGYANAAEQMENLPKIKSGVLSALDALKLAKVKAATIQHLNFLYAKDYSASDDLDIIWKGFRNLGNS